MRKLVLFRHGETDLNREHLVQGVSDPSLNDLGIEQAEKLALRLKALGISQIVSSDLKRARQTANIVAAKNGCSVTTYAELREQNYGRIELQPIAHVRHQYADICKIMDDINHPMTNTVFFPDAESRMDVFARASGRLNAIMSTSADNCIGVSTHAGVILSLMSVKFNQMAHLRNGEHLMLLHDGKGFVDYVML
jgi:broad specificity phosphatase PhoE